MINQIKKFIRKIPNSNFLFRLPEKKKILIYDDMPIEDFKFVFKPDNYFLLKTRYDNVDLFYLNPLIVIKTILKFRGNLWSAYLITIIETVSPNIVITCSDNDIKFSQIAKILEKKIAFFAVQNGARYDINKHKHLFEKGMIPKNYFKDIYIPNFFCFGKFEIDDYKKNNITVKKFYPVGSLRLANIIYEIGKKINLTSNKEYKYDLLLVSDGNQKDFDKIYDTSGEAEKMGVYINYVIKYVREKNKKFICSFKRLNSTKLNLDDEINFYKSHLKSDDYKFLIENSTLNFEKKRYLSYQLMFESELTISTYSTMLRENLSLGRKTLSVNLMQNQIYDFPLNGICKLVNCSYDEFKKRVDEIFKLNNKEYLNKLENKENYIMNFDKNFSTIEKIQKTINPHLA